MAERDRGLLRARGIGDAEELRRFGMKRRTDRQALAVERLVGQGTDFAEASARTFVADKFRAGDHALAQAGGPGGAGWAIPCPLLLIGLPAWWSPTEASPVARMPRARRSRGRACGSNPILTRGGWHGASGPERLRPTEAARWWSGTVRVTFRRAAAFSGAASAVRPRPSRNGRQLSAASEPEL